MNQTNSVALNGELVKVKLAKANYFSEANKSFNNDVSNNEEVKFFKHLMSSLYNILSPSKPVPKRFLYKNEAFQDLSKAIYCYGDKIFVGQYYNHGVVASKPYFVEFVQAFNCPPLISFIRGDKEHFSFLHVCDPKKGSAIVDEQVKQWMRSISNIGDVVETVFAPRKGFEDGDDTKVEDAVEHITKYSKKTILLERNINRLDGVVNNKGVYLEECGYHLWGR